MFKVVIDGRTPSELRKNIQLYLDETSIEEIKVEDECQLPLSTQPIVEAVTKSQMHYDCEPVFNDLPEVPVVAAVLPPTPSTPVYNGEIHASLAPIGNDELDSQGVPWDERIHAVTHGKNKDGSWRTRRGVEPSLVEKIESETKKTLVAERLEYQQANPFAKQIVYPTAPIIPPIPEPVVVPVAKPEPVTNAPQSATPVPSAHSFETFQATLVATLARLVSEGKLNQDYVNTLKKYFGIEQIWQVNDLQCREMFENFCAAGLIARV